MYLDQYDMCLYHFYCSSGSFQAIVEFILSAIGLNHICSFVFPLSHFLFKAPSLPL